MKDRNTGFTLIELLVVIAIIAILAAILFPVFTGAKARGKQVSCVSNMKQITYGIMMYAANNGERYPTVKLLGNQPPFYHYKMIQPYLKSSNVVRCPNQKYKGPGYMLNVDYAGWCNSLLGFDSCGTNYVWEHDCPAAMTGAVRRPTRVIMINDVWMNEGEAVFYSAFWPVYQNPGVHSDGDNFGFCDGHTKWIYTTNKIPTGSTWETKGISYNIHY